MFKNFEAVLTKAADDAPGSEGVFEAIVSVFGNVDSMGDRVLKGAFTKTLEEWEGSGNPIPVYWSHRTDDPEYNLGHVLEAKELDAGDELLPESLKDLGGLWVKTQLDLRNPKSVTVYNLFKDRRLTQFSFAYDIVDYSIVKEEDAEVWELKELKLYEVGPTPYGANSATELLAVKAARLDLEAKSGRVISAKNEGELKAARDSIDRVLASLGNEEDDEKSTSVSGAVKDDATSGSKSDSPREARTSSALLLINLATAELENL